MASGKGRVTFEEWQELSEITFEWADSYDSKLDYSEAFGTKYENLPAKGFVQMSNNPNRLGGIVDCIHHIGGSKFVKNSADEVTGYHQVRTEYKRYTSMDKKEVEATGQGLTVMLHFYKRIDGKWKLVGVKPTGRMSEFNFEKIFTVGSTARL